MHAKNSVARAQMNVQLASYLVSAILPGYFLILNLFQRISHNACEYLVVVTKKLAKD